MALKLEAVWVDPWNLLDNKKINGRDVLVGEILNCNLRNPMSTATLITSNKKQVRVNIFTDNQGRLRLENSKYIAKFPDGEILLLKDTEEYIIEDADESTKLLKVRIRKNVTSVLDKSRFRDTVLKSLGHGRRLTLDENKNFNAGTEFYTEITFEECKSLERLVSNPLNRIEVLLG